MFRLYERHRDVSPGLEHLQPEIDIYQFLIGDPEVDMKIKQDLCNLFVEKLFLGKRIVIRA
jgi:hypothetical protein